MGSEERPSIQYFPGLINLTMDGVPGGTAVPPSHLASERPGGGGVLKKNTPFQGT